MPIHNTCVAFNLRLVPDQLPEPFVLPLHYHEMQVHPGVLLEFLPHLAVQHCAVVQDFLQFVLDFFFGQSMVQWRIYDFHRQFFKESVYFLVSDKI